MAEVHRDVFEAELWFFGITFPGLTIPNKYVKWSYVFQITQVSGCPKLLSLRAARHEQNHLGAPGVSRRRLREGQIDFVPMETALRELPAILYHGQ
jgi:hypothetical protein